MYVRKNGRWRPAQCLFRRNMFFVRGSLLTLTDNLPALNSDPCLESLMEMLPENPGVDGT
jgi:hypothetical protein